MQEHHFNVEIAKNYGIIDAILFYHICYWVEKNKANETNFFDGDYWTYNSVNAYGELFPYLSKKQIRRALDKLVDAKLLKKGNYNKSNYDRTSWYTLGENGNSICPKRQIDLPPRAIPFAPQGKPIPNIIPNIIPNKKPSICIPPTLEDVKAYCLERKNDVDPERFIDYYQARGWELKKGQKVKDWKACIRNWERSEYNTPKKKGGIIESDYNESDSLF